VDEGKNRQIIVVVIIVVIVLVIIGYLIGGVRGLSSLLTFVKYAFIGVLIVGIAVWSAWYLFIRKERDDRVAMNVKKLIEQSRLTKPDTIGDLYISGDKEHPQIRLGHIIGYSRIKNIQNKEEDVFIFKKAGLPFSFFEEPRVLRVMPDQHSQMIGDIVVEGISLVLHGGFLYVNNEHLNIEGVDRTIKTEVLRTYTMDVLRDVKIISDMAIGIDPIHAKAMEGKSLLRIPSRTEPIAPQEGTYENPQGGR
jgi:hypothetical protein